MEGGTTLNLQYDTISLQLHVDMAVGIGGDKWPAADQFCSIITEMKWRSFFGSLFNGKSVIELGSGNGLVGIVIDKFYQPSEISISDLASHIPLIHHNIELNSASKTTIALEYDWCSPPIVKKYDIILALEWYVHVVLLLITSYQNL